VRASLFAEDKNFAGRAVDGDEGTSLGALAGDDAALPLLLGRLVASSVFNLPV
jgi:hypothetical protein